MSRRADLSEDSEFLLTLIDEKLHWRERLVEEFTFGGAAHVRASSSYQIDFPPDLLHRYVDTESHERANVLLPLTTRTKRPLLNLDIVGPGGAPAHLISRASIGALETQYLGALIDSSTAREALRAGLPDALLEAICVFTPDYFRSVLADEDGDHEQALLRYLKSGLGMGPDLTTDAVRGWREQTQAAAAVLERFSGWLPSGVSSSDEVLLAVPRVDPLPRSSAEVGALIDGFCDAVGQAAAAGDDLLLRSLAEYGRRFELIVEVEVPLLEPATIKLSEDRPLGWRRGWVKQDVSLGDARSAHVEARTIDPNVVIEAFAVEDAAGRLVGLGPLESARHTDETLALYTSEVERPEHVSLCLQLRPRRHLRLMSAALISLNLLATAVALAMPRDAVLIERLSLLTVPTTLAATFFLIREQTALAARLQAPTRVGLGVTTGILWLVVLVLVITFELSG